MAEKKIQENPLPEEQPEAMDKQKVTPKPVPDKTTTTVSLPTPAPVTAPRLTISSFTKTPPNDLYRRLLPAVLFLLTFVTVMTMLLIYMDTVALGAAQFRLNMSRDYELSRIPQGSPPLVAYVRQLHLAPRAPRVPPPVPSPTKLVEKLDELYGPIYNGTFVEFLPSGPRDPSTQYLEVARHWDGVAVRAAARDYLALRGAARTLHACLSPTEHPREVSYQESENQESVFRSRVLCLPLYTVLLAGDCERAQLVVLAGGAVVRALTHLPYDSVRLQAIEVRDLEPAALEATTSLLTSKNYSVAATFGTSVLYILNDGV